jgi:hypothetical protein
MKKSATFILDKAGRVTEEHSGMTDYSRDEIVNKIKALTK